MTHQPARGDIRSGFFFLEVEQAIEVKDALRPLLTGSCFITNIILLSNIGKLNFT